MEIKAKVMDVKCVCVSVVRTNWDASRKCFRYTATMRPSDEGSDDIFSQMDMFANDFRIPLRDEVLRKKPEFKTLVANDGDDDAKLENWDKIVAAQLENKETTVHTCTLTVAELTNGLFNSYVLEIGENSYEVTSRTISCIGSIESAVGRVANQVLRACKEQSENGEK